VRLAFLAALPLLLAGPQAGVEARRPPRPPPPPRPLLDALERLDLPDATRRIVDGIAEEHERAMREARERIVGETLSRLKAVLAADDYAQVEKEARRAPPPPPFHPPIWR
jgi:hypothetical protein